MTRYLSNPIPLRSADKAHISTFPVDDRFITPHFDLLPDRHIVNSIRFLTEQADVAYKF